MEKAIDQMTREELDNELAKFVFNATPNQLHGFITEVQSHPKYGKADDFLSVVKVVAIQKIFKELKVKKLYLNKTGRGMHTQLFIDEGPLTLLIGKKDQQDFDAMYARLYDQHKDELLQIIESRSAATPKKEVVQI